jgi:hypothetical protein
VIVCSSSFRFGVNSTILRYDDYDYDEVLDDPDVIPGDSGETNVKAKVRTLGILGMSTVMILTAALGCSGSQQPSSYVWRGRDDATGQNVSHQQGQMPAGHDFTGVYRSPQIGDVQIVQTGQHIVGTYDYDRANCHVTARFEGSVTGNLAKFSWREDHRACGRLAPITGKGFFLYVVETTQQGDTEIQRGRIFGRWGLGDDDGKGRSDNPWVAFKIPGRTPEINEAMQAEVADGGTEDQ